MLEPVPSHPSPAPRVAPIPVVTDRLVTSRTRPSLDRTCACLRPRVCCRRRNAARTAPVDVARPWNAPRPPAPRVVTPLLFPRLSPSPPVPTTYTAMSATDDRSESVYMAKLAEQVSLVCFWARRARAGARVARRAPDRSRTPPRVRLSLRAHPADVRLALPYRQLCRPSATTR